MRSFLFCLYILVGHFCLFGFKIEIPKKPKPPKFTRINVQLLREGTGLWESVGVALTDGTGLVPQWYLPAPGRYRFIVEHEKVADK